MQAALDIIGSVYQGLYSKRVLPWERMKSLCQLALIGGLRFRVARDMQTAIPQARKLQSSFMTQGQGSLLGFKATAVVFLP